MDIRKYFNSPGCKPSKIIEKNNNEVKISMKQDQINNALPKSKNVKHKDSSTEKSKSAFSMEDKKANKHECDNKKEKSEKKKLKNMEETSRSFKEKETNENKKEKKTFNKESDKTTVKEEDNKVKEKMKSIKKKHSEERKKTFEQKKIANENSDSEDRKLDSKQKQKTKMKRKHFESSNESEDITEDESGCEKKESCKKKSVSERISGKLKKCHSKRQCVQNESDEDFNENIKSSTKTKKNKKQIQSDEDSDDIAPRLHKKRNKRMKKSNRISDSDSEREVVSKAKRRKGDSIFSESDEDNRASKSPIKNFFKPKLANEENMSASKANKSPGKNPKSVSVSDFFGSSTVQRTERKEKNLSSPKQKISESCEDEFHDDDDFVATLELLDKKEEKIKEISEENKLKKWDTSPQKKTGSEKTSEPGLAEKLAIKMKCEKLEALKITPALISKAVNNEDIPTPIIKNINIPETPEQKQPTSDHGSAYRAYLNREGPKALGSKEIPQGADNCLEGLTFVITGVLESIERDEAKSLIERYSGKVTTSLSGKTSYIIIGRDAGESKLKKAISLKTAQLDEDGLFDLIQTKPGKKSKYLINAEKAIKEETYNKNDEVKKEKSKMDSLPSKTFEKSQKPAPSVLISSDSPTKTKESKNGGESLLWVDKYKPKSLKQIIGQSGDKSNAKKLMAWLQNWQSNREANVKPTNRIFGNNDTGAGMKAALLSGPPGVGKTTTAHLVCQEIGFSVVEMNASDTRSKSCLQSEVMTLLQNSSLTSFYGNGKSTTAAGKKHCLIMDEVDGMAGNEDRGGVAELIQLIKSSKIPIICLCNDRQHPKIRSLVNYCLDLRFQRPRVEQIKAAMMSVAFKEGLKISPPALQEIIVAANQDVRQIIHNLSMLTSSTKNLSYDEAKINAQKSKKDIKLGPFDVCRQVFIGGEETRKMSIDDKSDLFFHDYQLSPLFVQENYPSVHPYAGRKSPSHHLSLLAHTAESICDGDLVEQLIRRQQNWGLLPMEAMYASVLPGEYMRGNVSHMVSFPKWLGKFSSRNKNERILQELSSHMRLCISSDKRGFNLDYLPCLRQHLIKPLKDLEKDGVPQVIKLMDEYDIIKEDYDNIMEFTKWPNTLDHSKMLSSSTKAAFTRAYNKESHMTPYSTGTLSKKRNKSTPALDDFFEEEDDNEEDDDIDSMIKKKKPSNPKDKNGGKQTKKTKGKNK